MELSVKNMRKLHDENASFTLGQPNKPSVHEDPIFALMSLVTSLYKSNPNRLLFQNPTSLADNPTRFVTGLLAGVNALMLESQDETTSIASEPTSTITSLGKRAGLGVRVAVGEFNGTGDEEGWLAGELRIVVGNGCHCGSQALIRLVVGQV